MPLETTEGLFIDFKLINFGNDVAVEQFRECVKFLANISEDQDALRQKLTRTLQVGFETISAFADIHHKALLYKDFAPLSFMWSAGGITGGLIYHGPHDGFGSGSAPTYSVCVDKVSGWSIHT